MSLPRYAKYTRSGVSWVPEIPSHWTVWPLKRVAELKSGDGITSEDIEVEGDFPVYGGNGVRGFADRFTHDGDFALIGRQGALCGNINYASGRFWASEHAVVVTPVKQVEMRWLGELLRAMNLNQYSVSAAQPGLSVEVISNHRIPVPPLVEQSAIAAFLDRETGKIDALIAEQEKLLALLAEKRQATISHAVTRGLTNLPGADLNAAFGGGPKGEGKDSPSHPSAPMKDSGVPWLGEVPAHWEFMSLGRITDEKCDGPFGSGIKSDHYTETGALVVRLQNIRQSGFFVGDPAYLDRSYFESELYRHAVHANDLLIAGLGDENNLVGRACVAPEGLGPALVKADCFRFRLGQRVEPAFIAQQLNVSAKFDAGLLSTGSTRSRIPLGVMASRKIALPPKDEQRMIVRYIAEATAQFDGLFDGAERAIDLLKERRSALIAAAVTGKVDVRGSVPIRTELKSHEKTI